MIRINLKNVADKKTLKYLIDSITKEQATIKITTNEIDKIGALNLSKIIDINELDTFSLAYLIQEYNKCPSDLSVENKIITILIDRLKEAPKNLWQSGRAIPNAIRSSLEIISRSKRKEDVVVSIIDNTRHFDSVSKKKLIHYASTLTSDYDKAELIIGRFKSIIEPGDLNILLNKFSELYDNKEIKKLIEGNIKFVINSITENDLNDQSKRKGIIKMLAKHKSAYKGLKHKVVINKNDIAELPPVMRLDFLEWFYRDKFWATYLSNGISATYLKHIKRFKKYDFLEIKDMDVESMKQILLPVAIAKNSRVERFVEKYAAHYNFHHKGGIYFEARNKLMGYWR